MWGCAGINERAAASAGDGQFVRLASVFFWQERHPGAAIGTQVPDRRRRDIGIRAPIPIHSWSAGRNVVQITGSPGCGTQLKYGKAARASGHFYCLFPDAITNI